MIRIRPVTMDDAPALTEAYLVNRRFLAPFDPVRDEAFFTTAYQRDRIEQALDEMRDGTGHRCVICYGGDVVGMISLSTVVRGPAQTADLGYWVAQEVNGRGVATEAVRQLLDVAFGQLALHRVEAGTLRHNTASQRVLARNGFERIGLARAFLRIAGAWQDHILFQRLADPGEMFVDEGDTGSPIRDTG